MLPISDADCEFPIVCRTPSSGQIRKAYKKQAAVALTLECVKSLDQINKDEPPGQISDAQYMCNCIEEDKFWSHKEFLDAKKWGSFVPRNRLYWVGLAGLSGKKEDITCYFQKVLKSARLPQAQCMTATDCFTLDAASRRKQAEAIGFPLTQDSPTPILIP